MSLDFDYTLACPRCAASVTAWQGNPATGRFFEPDDYNPYQPHRCNALVLATLRQAAAMERLADVTEQRNALRAAQTMPATLPEEAWAIPLKAKRPTLAVVGKQAAAAPARAMRPIADELEF